MLLVLFAICFVPNIAAQNENSLASERFNQYIVKIPEKELPAFFPYSNTEYSLVPKDSLFYKWPDVRVKQINYSDIFGVGYISLKESPFVLIFFSLGDGLMDICCYNTNGDLIDRLITYQHYFHDNVVVTENNIIKTIDNISSDEDTPFLVEKQYQVDIKGKICFQKQINYIELARPWVEEKRAKRKEEVEALKAKLAQTNSAEANNIFDHVDDYFTPIDASEWMNCIRQLNFCEDDLNEDYPYFWSSLKLTLYNYIDSARYVYLDYAFYYQLFEPYVTDDYKKAIELYIADDYALEGPEELLVDRQDLAKYVIEREQYARNYPTNRHALRLLQKCPVYLESFLFNEGVNTSTFENTNKRKIINSVFELIVSLQNHYPDSRLSKVFHLFLDELKKTDNSYTTELKQMVMKYAEKIYEEI